MIVKVLILGFDKWILTKKELNEKGYNYHWLRLPNDTFDVELEEADAIDCGLIETQQTDDTLPDDEGMFNSPQFLPNANDDGLPF